MDEIYKVNTAVVGFDFEATPTSGNNQIESTYTVIINDGDEIQKINTATDYIQKVN